MPINIYFIVALILLVGCTIGEENSTEEKEKTISLEPRYQDFKTLISTARCQGPNGNYSTEVHSTKDNYTYFRQEHGGEKAAFTAIIIGGKEGYSLDEKGVATDTLSKESIEVIKGHEFHKIHMNPNQYFEQIEFNKTEIYQGESCEKYIAYDLLNNQVNLYYNRKEKLIEGYSFKNPTDTTERIEVRYKAWMNSTIGKIAKEVEIIQGATDRYTFDFEKVLINDANFERRKK